MLDFLELEETVGRFWHRLVGQTASWPHYPQAAVSLAEMRTVLNVCFRGFGGEAGAKLTPARGRSASHRLNWRQRVGLGEERLIQPFRTRDSLHLPPAIALFPERCLNRDLYIWLSACFAEGPEQAEATGLLQEDVGWILAAERMVEKVLCRFPGLRSRYARLAAATLAQRRRQSLPALEAKVEQLIRRLLAGESVKSPDDDVLSSLQLAPAPPGYLPALPVPLWPRMRAVCETSARREGNEEAAAPSVPAADAGIKPHSALREAAAERKDRSAFILNRFEKILAMSEMVRVDRPADDSDENDPKAADELDEMVLGERKGRPASRFRFDLDLPPEAVDRTRLSGTHLYPEWDFRTGSYLEDHCRVLTATVPAASASQGMDETTRRLVRRLRRQFEVLRPRSEPRRAQLDGPELDLDAVIRRQADLAAGCAGSERIHIANRPRTFDLAVTTLMDVSLSTDAWFDDLRVLDVEKQALSVLAHSVAACGDRHEILTFTSRRRDWVRVETVKNFSEPMSERVDARIAALKPGFYTRIGAAIRHAASGLKKQPERRKLLLILTDGKPNDIDHYEGRFAMEDTRKAVAEARRAGLAVFAVTVDRESRAYIPFLFGHGGHAIVSRLSRLPLVLPSLYRMIAA